jgi:hypothetical protein
MALAVNQNPTYLPNTTATAQIVAASGTASKLTIETYNQGTGGIGSTLVLRTSQGNATALSSSLAGDVLGAVVSRGYGATSYQINTPLTSTGMIVQAAQNFSDTAQGTNLLFNTTANNFTTARTVMSVTAGGNVVITGNLSIQATTGSPTNTASTAGWLKDTVHHR